MNNQNNIQILLKTSAGRPLYNGAITLSKALYCYNATLPAGSQGRNKKGLKKPSALIVLDILVLIDTNTKKSGVSIKKSEQVAYRMGAGETWRRTRQQRVSRQL